VEEGDFCAAVPGEVYGLGFGVAKIAEQEEKWKKEISASAVTIRVQALLKDRRKGLLRGAKCHLCQLILTACSPQR